MYNAYYGLRESPFHITPDPRFLFFSDQHREAFHHVLFGIRERKGFIQITGEVGAGKTTICRAILEELGPSFRTALILNPILTSTQLLRAILIELGLKPRKLDRASYQDMLNAFLFDQVAAGRDVVLIIDEAQDLDDDLLEQVRLLSNLETDQRKLLQIVLIGQPELREKLENRSLRQLRQRITVRYHLRPLSREDTERYIAHRLRVAGGNGRPSFTPWAIRRIHAYAGGIPRLVNAVCDKALLYGYVNGIDRLDARGIRRAIRELEGHTACLVQGKGVERKYLLPIGSHLMVGDGQDVHPGDVLAKIPRETTKTKDITGGLPRIVELFEARRPKDAAVITEIDGTVSHGPITKGMRKVIISGDDGETREYLIPRYTHVNVQESERVRAGDPLIDGPINPHDILAILGEKEMQRYLVDKIQEVYRSQNVAINDKHIEVIVRQMMRSVKIEEVGDTEFLIDEQVDRFRFEEENERVIAANGQPALGRPLLLGITKASLSTDSFISAASFQETTRVLTEASISGKVDSLRGLKENVIVGRLIPAGTGMEYYRNVVLEREEIPQVEEPALEDFLTDPAEELALAEADAEVDASDEE